jgi:hypothetical protein
MTLQPKAAQLLAMGTMVLVMAAIVVFVST